jgi:CheY-like chemotaxis protein
MARLLVVEDEPNQLSLYCEWLEDFHDTRCVLSGEEALIVIENESIDLIISDVGLPKMSGFELKAICNRRGIRTPFIFLTGHLITDGIDRSRQLGAVSYLLKPLLRKQLLDEISRGLVYSKLVRYSPEFLKPIAKLNIYQEELVLELLIAGGSYLIGRSADAHIHLDHQAASRHHAALDRIFHEPTNQSLYKIVDYSRNGLSVNGKRVNAFYDLKNGDILSFPGTRIVYYELGRGESVDPKSTLPNESNESK